jgi:hypothetical protein
MIHNILKDKSTKLFILLGGIFIASALIAEVIGVKIFSFEDTLGIKEPISIYSAALLVFILPQVYCCGR